MVAVIGPADASPDEEELAEEVGRRLAYAGITLVTGGRGGVMAAACRGAVSAAGLTVGLLPGTDRGDANPWVRVPIATGLGEARNALVAGSVDAVIAVGGAYGTLSEIAFALKAGRPVVGLGTWSMARGDADDDPVVRAASAQDAVAQVLRHLEGPR